MPLLTAIAASAACQCRVQAINSTRGGWPVMRARKPELISVRRKWQDGWSFIILALLIRAATEEFVIA